jgi:hypothetical protein
MTHAPPDEPEWFSPLGVLVVTGVCPIESTDCGPYERLALEVEMYDTRGIVLDGSNATVGPLMGPYAYVNVQEAWMYHDLICDGPPSTWYQFALVIPPSM